MPVVASATLSRRVNDKGWTAPAFRPQHFFYAVIAVFLILLSQHMAIAGSATWKLNPANGNWNRAGNWMPPTVPNAFSDTATFGVSNVTDVSFSANTEVSAITFTSGASAFTITVAPGLQLSLSGTGISNNSQSTQKFCD